MYLLLDFVQVDEKLQAFTLRADTSGKLHVELFDQGMSPLLTACIDTPTRGQSWISFRFRPMKLYIKGVRSEQTKVLQLNARTGSCK